MRAILDTPAPVSRVGVLDEEGHLMRKCALEDEGEFVLWGLAPGRYRVTAQGVNREEFVSVAPVWLSPGEVPVVKLVQAPRLESQTDDASSVNKTKPEQ